jgi:hypothetical protein
MNELKRYMVKTESYGGCSISRMSPISNGKWCDADEVLSRFAQKDTRIAELEEDVAHALKEAKDVVPDYPWGDGDVTLPQIIWALTSTIEGIMLANSDLHQRITELESELKLAWSDEHDPLVARVAELENELSSYRSYGDPNSVYDMGVELKLKDMRIAELEKLTVDPKTMPPDEYLLLQPELWKQKLALISDLNTRIAELESERVAQARIAEMEAERVAQAPDSEILKNIPPEELKDRAERIRRVLLDPTQYWRRGEELEGKMLKAQEDLLKAEERIRQLERERDEARYRMDVACDGAGKAERERDAARAELVAKDARIQELEGRVWTKEELDEARQRAEETFRFLMVCSEEPAEEKP